MMNYTNNNLIINVKTQVITHRSFSLWTYIYKELDVSIFGSFFHIYKYEDGAKIMFYE